MHLSMLALATAALLPSFHTVLARPINSLAPRDAAMKQDGSGVSMCFYSMRREMSNGLPTGWEGGGNQVKPDVNCGQVIAGGTGKDATMPWRKWVGLGADDLPAQYAKPIKSFTLSRPLQNRETLDYVVRTSADGKIWPVKRFRKDLDKRPEYHDAAKVPGQGAVVNINDDEGDVVSIGLWPTECRPWTDKSKEPYACQKPDKDWY